MQSETEAPAQPDTPAPGPGPIPSRKIAWAIAALLLAGLAAGTLWAVQTWQTNRALANVENSVTGQPLSALSAARTSQQPAPTPAPAPLTDEAPAVRSADRLPALVLPGQPVPAAVLRDLPEWVAADFASAQTSAQTSGSSGDESTAVAAVAPVAAAAAPLQEPAPQRQRAATAPRRDRYGAVFARCPGPGESGAVECRRAVCDGAARKTAACAPYLK